MSSFLSSSSSSSWVCVGVQSRREIRFSINEKVIYSAKIGVSKKFHCQKKNFLPDWNQLTLFLIFQVSINTKRRMFKENWTFQIKSLMSWRFLKSCWTFCGGGWRVRRAQNGQSHLDQNWFFWKVRLVEPSRSPRQKLDHRLLDRRRVRKSIETGHFVFLSFSDFSTPNCSGLTTGKSNWQISLSR